MKQPGRALLALFTALTWCHVAASQTLADAAALAAQDLKQLTVTGKVSLAMWTRRTGDYTLQLVHDSPKSRRFIDDTMAMLRGKDTARANRWQPSEIQVWLLQPDGMVIGHERKSPPLPVGRTRRPASPYSFALSAVRQANAVEVRLNSEYRIQPLAPFKD